MATNEVLITQGTQLLFADATDFPNSGDGPPTTAANDIRRTTPTPTKVQIDCTALGAAGGARQSAKTADLARFGTEIVEWWNCKACIEHATAPAAGETVDFFWNSSPNSTAATGNMGGASGSDATYTAALESQMDFIGSLILGTPTTNIGDIGNFRMTERFGSLIVINQSAADLFAAAGNMDETHIVLNPLIPDIQAAT